MQRPVLAVVFMYVALCGLLISAFPSNDHLERGGGSSVQLQSQDGHLADTNFGHASDKSKQSLFPRGRGQSPGARCDGTMYKQEKVEAVAAKACQKANGGGFGSIRHSLPKLFRGTLQTFPGSPKLFPYEHPSSLRMMRITNSFFPVDKISRFLKISGKDYVVFAGQCRPVGIVRNTNGNNYVLCTATSGTSVFSPSGPPPQRPAYPY